MDSDCHLYVVYSVIELIWGVKDIFREERRNATQNYITRPHIFASFIQKNDNEIFKEDET